MTQHDAARFFSFFFSALLVEKVSKMMVIWAYTNTMPMTKHLLNANSVESRASDGNSLIITTERIGPKKRKFTSVKRASMKQTIPATITGI